MINCERGFDTLNPSSLVVHPSLILDAILLNKVFEFEFQFLGNVGDHDMASPSIISNWVMFPLVVSLLRMGIDTPQI